MQKCQVVLGIDLLLFGEICSRERSLCSWGNEGCITVDVIAKAFSPRPALYMEPTPCAHAQKQTHEMENRPLTRCWCIDLYFLQHYISSVCTHRVLFFLKRIPKSLLQAKQSVFLHSLKCVKRGQHPVLLQRPVCSQQPLFTH